MKRLLLVRHAKSSWKGDHDDYDRPLNRRGQGDAPRIGAWIRARDHVPEAALVSAAVRARSTFARLFTESAPPPARFLDALYHATPEDMLSVLRGARGGSVMMVGHNPGIGAFATQLLAEAPEDPDYARFPTAATAVISFAAADWSEVAWGTGTLADFMIPKRLG
ncbi:SixA phosphatase family protein [Amaricoccus sp. W119]|uniref:SixA phosphatase family protein n=1 Tax=Amaricoccus sp. W119 TaxID=3391833 RepID=UPI0039A5D85A